MRGRRVGLTWAALGCAAGLALAQTSGQTVGQTVGQTAPALVVPPPGAPAKAAAAQSAAAPSTAQTSGLPLPRFVSLKSDKVYIRQGPGTDHKVLWVYRRAGLPVEVLQEFEVWRQVRDAEGSLGWVLQTLISGRRTALVLPWEQKAAESKAAAIPQTALLADEKDNARPIAYIEAGVIANVRSCSGKWCHVSVGEFRGYIQQKKLWGVYEGEIVK